MKKVHEDFELYSGYFILFSILFTEDMTKYSQLTMVIVTSAVVFEIIDMKI